ncbi:hypothetical protein BPT24_125 [Tenacibaculum phage pT24]|uniref:Uncharacterized protein n=1 Tax=Tenacibaculum phage pT24 TaxID=1880590 RepID=A0A1B4XWQ9_9CAUD|nr:hypothetical protein HYP10_gp125 [Tenacibaculum phage pT24]BAV39250.1 hypothetical protein BPT24_125 [Tenacibaculum phage pT24]
MSTLGFSGVESKSNQPMDGKTHVDSLSVAVNNDPDYNIPNMVIFVKDEKTLYYLKDGAIGDDISHWAKLGDGNSLSTFEPFTAKAYTLGETASVGANMFICISNTTASETPITSPEKWLQLGATSKYKSDFNDVTGTITIDHAINDAICNIYDENGMNVEVGIQKTSASQFVLTWNGDLSGTIIIS